MVMYPMGDQTKEEVLRYTATDKDIHEVANLLADYVVGCEEGSLRIHLTSEAGEDAHFHDRQRCLESNKASVGHDHTGRSGAIPS